MATLTKESRLPIYHERSTATQRFLLDKLNFYCLLNANEHQHMLEVKMGLWDSIKKNVLLDDIEWQDNSGDTIIWKFPRNDCEIKNGANLTVRESQAAGFLWVVI